MRQKKIKMRTLQEREKYTTQVSDSFEHTDDSCTFEPSFRRWLVQQIEEQKMTVAQAIEQFNFHPKNGYDLIRYWREKYAPFLVISLPPMTAKEQQEIAQLQQQLKAAEKQLEDAKMKNIALDILINVAEEKFKINIRKKHGAKQ